MKVDQKQFARNAFRVVAWACLTFGMGCGKAIRSQENTAPAPSPSSAEAAGVQHPGATSENRAISPSVTPLVSPVSTVSPTPASTPLQNVAERLGVFILASGNDSAFPDRSQPISPTSERTGVNEVIASEDEVVFQNTVIIPVSGDSSQNRPLFLVWNENALGSPIREAHFEYRIQNLQNQREGDVDRFNASFDEATRRWFVPIQRLFRGSISDIDPTDHFLVTLDLVLADTTRHQVKIRFRAVGPLPRLHVEFLPVPPTGDSLQMTGTLIQGGWIFRRVQLRNPSTRELTVWARTQVRTPFRAISLLNHRFHSSDDQEALRGSQLERQISVTDLDFRLLKRGGRIGPQGAVVPMQGWAPISLGAGEQLTLEWMGFVHSNVARCALPDPLQRTIRRMSREGASHPDDRLVPWPYIDPIPLSPLIPPAFIFDRTVVDSWSLPRFSIVGDWSAELRLAGNFVPLEEATGAISELSPGVHRVIPVNYQDFQIELHSSATGPDSDPLPGLTETLGLPHFACQGLF